MEGEGWGSNNMEQWWIVRKLKDAADIDVCMPDQCRFLCSAGTEMESISTYEKYRINCITQVAKN